MKSRKLTIASFVLITTLLMAACAEKSQVPVVCPDISAGCAIDGLTVRTGQSPQVLKPFELAVQWAQGEAAGISEVYASFAMEGMEMGLNRYRLIQKSENLWQAEVTLPLCVRGRADWIMQVEAKTRFGSRTYLVAFYTG
ncbi:MAG: hypothetical protein CVU35_02565 [Betaproteobacteria bacterium HGW-Betaproteobacteria-8]|nr:MAG: hypothetical protein CVU35_02565 [Betaproteobacteria bacterium HGW-Betaproteobacteria-8]